MIDRRIGEVETALEEIENNERTKAQAPKSFDVTRPATDVVATNLPSSSSIGPQIRNALSVVTQLVEYSKWVVIALCAATALIIGGNALRANESKAVGFTQPSGQQSLFRSGTPNSSTNADFTMMLLIRRSQRFTLFLRRPRFIMHFKADVTPEEVALIKKYKLWGSFLHTSKEFEQRLAAANAPKGVMDLIRPFYAAFLRMFSWISLFFALKLTVKTLVNGKRVEKSDLGELLFVEKEVVQACEALKNYLDVARTFDGRTVRIEV
jgi:hypothetical protein